MIPVDEWAVWAAAKFPLATPANGALKVCEEAGEVAACLNKHRPKSELADELADTIIACVSTARLAGIDIDSAVVARWDEVRRR